MAYYNTYNNDWTGIILVGDTVDYAIFRKHTHYVVSEVDHWRLTQYIVHKDDLTIEYIVDSETPDAKSLRIWDNERVLLLDMATDSDGNLILDGNYIAGLISSYDITGEPTTPVSTIDGIFSAITDWLTYIP